VHFLAGHLLLLGYRAAGAKDVAAALRMLALASPPDPRRPARQWITVCRSCGGAREIVAPLAAIPCSGSRSDTARRFRDREAARRRRAFALFDPSATKSCASVVTEAHHAALRNTCASEQRVPARIRARVTTMTGERVAVVCTSRNSAPTWPRRGRRCAAERCRSGLPLGDGEVEIQGS